MHINETSDLAGQQPLTCHIHGEGIPFASCHRYWPTGALQCSTRFYQFELPSSSLMVRKCVIRHGKRSQFHLAILIS